MKPFLKYPGGKTSELPLVQRYKPAIVKRFFEPFVGGGAVYFDINIKESFINDKSEDLFYLYVFIKEQNQDFYNYVNLINKSWQNIDVVDFEALGLDKFVFNNYYTSSLKRKNNLINKLECDGKNVSDENKIDLETTAKKTALYTVLRDEYNNPNTPAYKKIAIFYFLREYCYSSMFRFNALGEFNVPYGGMSYNDKSLDTKLEYIFSDEMKVFLENTAISNVDFEQFFNNHTFHETDFIFLDPPYDSEFSTYDNNGFNREDQIRLRDSLSNIRAKWMLIIKRTDFIFELYKNFYVYEYDKTYTVSFKNRNKKDSTHLLITNYRISEEV